MSLRVGERASLAHKILASLDEEPTEAIEEAWIPEADRRADQVTRGEVDLVSGDEVFRRAFARRRGK